MKYPLTIDEAVVAMKRCEQFPGFSVFDHGNSVFDHYQALVDVLIEKRSPEAWRLPKKLPVFAVKALENVHTAQVLQNYMIYHDIGKPYCRVLDASGQYHFPNHAEVSSEIAKRLGFDTTICRLMLFDMDLHVEKSERVEHRLKHDWSLQDACSLALVSLSEIHANARMFGGIESTSFKIKFKALERRINQVLDYHFT